MKHLHKLFYILLSISIFCSCKDEVITSEDTYETPAVKDIVMYEVNIRCFSSTADFNGITLRLDSIQQLGINTIWLMPIYPVGQLNSVGGLGSPYSVQNYTEVNPEFGNLSDLENLISEAHKRHIAIILDWVANHTSWDNPWIVNTDWYTQDGSGNIISPAGTGWADVADLNYSNADMRLAMIDAMAYWVNDIHIDGFRCDAADLVPFDFWQQAIDSLRSIKQNMIMLAEGARADHFTAGFDMNYAWNFYTAVKNVFINNYAASTIFTTHFSETDALPAGKYKLRFTTNHDETAWDQTPISLFNGVDGALAASVITIFMNGIPLIYDGQEVGSSVNLPLFNDFVINWNQNPEMLSTYKKLFSFYNMYPALKLGTITQYTDSYIVAFKKSNANTEALILVNVKNVNKDFVVPTDLLGTTWKNLFDQTDNTLGTTISLPPYGFKIFVRDI